MWIGEVDKRNTREVAHGVYAGFLLMSDISWSVVTY